MVLLLGGPKAKSDSWHAHFLEPTDRHGAFLKSTRDMWSSATRDKAHFLCPTSDMECIDISFVDCKCLSRSTESLPHLHCIGRVRADELIRDVGTWSYLLGTISLALSIAFFPRSRKVMKPARFREWHCTVRCGPVFPLNEDEVTNDKQICLMTSDMSVS